MFRCRGTGLHDCISNALCSLLCTTNSIYCSDGVSEPWALVPQFSNLLVTHARDQVLFLAFLTTRVDPMEREPQDRVTRNRKRNHGHGNGVALDEPRALFRRVDLSTQLALP
jgi:hypothetical protein